MKPSIVLIHGAWMSAASWGPFRGRHEARGYVVHTPSWPFSDRPVAELRTSPDPRLAKVGVTAIVEHMAAFVRTLPEPPILIGHSFGGLFVQMLLDRGLGVAGVAIDSAPPKGVFPTLDAVRAGASVLLPWGKAIHHLSLADFAWGWVHTLPADEQKRIWEEFCVPTPRKLYLDGLAAPFTSVMEVNFRNADRPPLLLIAGGEDRTVSASMNRQNAEKYGTDQVAFKEFPGRTHWICGQPGWEEVADYAIEWVEGLTARPRP